MQRPSHQRGRYQPELPVRMFETIDNVTMIKESTGDLSRMRGSASSAAAGSRSATAISFWRPDALRADGAAWCTAALCLRPRPCIGRYDATRAGELPGAQDIYMKLKPLLEFIVAGGLATMVKGVLELRGTGVWRSAPPLLPLDDGSRVALQKLLTFVS